MLPDAAPAVKVFFGSSVRMFPHPGTYLLQPGLTSRRTFIIPRSRVKSTLFFNFFFKKYGRLRVRANSFYMQLKSAIFCLLLLTPGKILNCANVSV